MVFVRLNEALPHANARGRRERGLISDLVLISTEVTFADRAQFEGSSVRALA